MKCLSCNGTGTWGKADHDGELVDIICPYCHGKKEVDLTNEQWFSMLSIDKKAEVLAEKCRHAYVGYVPSEGTVSNEEWWEHWLKEKHED